MYHLTLPVISARFQEILQCTEWSISKLPTLNTYQMWQIMLRTWCWNMHRFTITLLQCLPGFSVLGLISDRNFISFLIQIARGLHVQGLILKVHYVHVSTLSLNSLLIIVIQLGDSSSSSSEIYHSLSQPTLLCELDLYKLDRTRHLQLKIGWCREVIGFKSLKMSG